MLHLLSILALLVIFGTMIICFFKKRRAEYTLLALMLITLLVWLAGSG